MRSPVTGLVEQFNALTEVEQKVFLDLVDPQPESAVPAKQARKKRGPSKRAESISSVISKTPKADADNGDALETDSPKCGVCGNPEEYQEHFQPSPNFHEFEAPKAKKAKSA